MAFCFGRSRKAGKPYAAEGAAEMEVITLRLDEIKPYANIGYIHDEHGTKSLSDKEKKLIDRITSVWNNRHGKQ